MKISKAKGSRIPPSLRAEIIKIVEERLKFWGYSVKKDRKAKKKKLRG
ncbi:MAG: hypothetical protein ACK4TF_06010 [Thermodesulfovibrionales bacterium]